MLGGLNPVHLIILLVIVLLIFGPSRLAGAGKALGESLREFKKTMNDTSESKPETTAKSEATEKEKEKVEA
ncbi:MAG: twin-arginine translocase TatA/TatE family subunit [Actinobacteria bacterium]|nr:twin-arginine translocase TatA/TatE family subunit [Actinomycetota bacterium]